MRKPVFVVGGSRIPNTTESGSRILVVKKCGHTVCVRGHVRRIEYSDQILLVAVIREREFYDYEIVGLK